MYTLNRSKFYQLRDLRTPAFKLYVFLLFHSDEHGVVRMSQQEMSKQSKMSSGSVTHALKLLEKSGHVMQVHGQGRNSSEYVLVKENIQSEGE